MFSLRKVGDYSLFVCSFFKFQSIVMEKGMYKNCKCKRSMIPLINTNYDELHKRFAAESLMFSYFYH